jgi:glycosyltransferase involved in cell wall biosynthesis
MSAACEATAVEAPPRQIDVTIVMPCLNEARCLPVCLRNARLALDEIEQRFGLTGEIVVADNGSLDGSPAIALSLGGRPVPVSRRGYGAAISGGVQAAHGRYIVMGDADGSYDFRDSVRMIEALMNGADLCMGSRFTGTIAPGAMPWKNRYIGNPVLTGALNLLFHAGVSDAHCGLRAFTRASFMQLGLCGSGMEFASEMIIKAALKNFRIAEVPVTLSPDLRDRPPHLRPWRDGWRHLRYLLMLSPIWLFGLPAMLVATGSLTILLYAAYIAIAGFSGESVIGNYWVILAGAMLGMSHAAGLLAAASHLYGVRENYRRPSPLTVFLARWVSLETMLVAGLGGVLAGLAMLFAVVAYWSAGSYGPIFNVLPAVAGISLIVIGVQNALGGFLLAIICGNEADFLGEMNRAEKAFAPSHPLLPEVVHDASH